MIYSLGNQQPIFDSSNFIADSADLIGNVVLKKNASVWFQCVLRADNDQIIIGKDSNIQDASVLHVDANEPLIVGDKVTVGHKVMLHSCTIGDNSLIGMNAVVLNGAVIGKNCIVGANALVTENTVVPDGMLVLGSPAKVIKPLNDKQKAMLAEGADHYVKNAKKYTALLKAV